MLRARNPQAEDPQQEQITELLKQLQLSPMERRIAESYLRGESGEAALRGLRRRDMMQVPQNLQGEIRAILDNYCMQEQYAEASRYFKFLYALYASSLGNCICHSTRCYFAVENGQLQVDMSVVLSVYAQYMVPKVYVESGQVVKRRYLRARDLERMAEFIRYDLQVVRQALKDYQEEIIDVKMILYTLYFYMRSSRVPLNAGRSMWDSTSSLGQRRSTTRGWAIGGVKKRATEKDEPPVVIGPPGLDGTDRALLREYENVNEEEYTLPELLPRQGQIGLVHPLELSEESLEAWRRQLEDNEITQPVEQLGRTVYHLSPEEQEGSSLECFDGVVINDLSLGGRLTAMGWLRGPVQGGRFAIYYREEPSLGLGAELQYSGGIVGSASTGGRDVRVRDVRFYRVGTVDRGPESYDEVTEGRQLSLKNIPQRFFSEIVWQIAKATAAR